MLIQRCRFWISLFWFKCWLDLYGEIIIQLRATRYDFSGANLTGIEGIPTATIVPWTTASVPSGFLECDGSAVSRSTYSALFAIVGTTYGTGDGSSTLTYLI